MILFKKSAELHNYLGEQRKKGLKIGFVPTMGALHNGHLSLINEAKANNEITVASIFVNPTQFNDPQDYQKYPVTIEKDILLLESAGCDILFLPSVTEIYPTGTELKNRYDLGYLEEILEGKYRPGHFQGVCAVVHRLLEIVMPDNLYIGQKDYQQCLVIKKLIGLTGMANLIKVNISTTLREKNGLAMSSRNTRLTDQEREKASAIYQSLTGIRERLSIGELGHLKQQAVSSLTKKGFKVDYIEIADAANLKIVNHWNGKQKLVAVAAAYLGEVRLIDNILLN